MSEALWPYLVVIGAGFLPNEVFRIAGVLLGRNVDAASELFTWIKIVAIALLAAVVSKLLFAPPAALAAVPPLARIGAVTIGVAGFYAARRNVLAAILVGEALLIGSAWAFG